MREMWSGTDYEETLADTAARAISCGGCKPSHRGVLGRAHSAPLWTLPASLRCSVFARQSRTALTAAPASRLALRLRPGAADLLKHRLEHVERREDVLVRERPRALAAAC